MKVSLLAFSFVFLAFTIQLFIGKTNAAPEPVLDTSGQKLKRGVKYHIVPVARGKGGGLTVSSTDAKNPCPFFVVQEKLEVSKGTPVTFSPLNGAKDDVILTSTNLNIISHPKGKTCDKPVWKILKELTGVWFLSTGGVEGNPGVDTIGNWFKIEKAGKDYVLSFCPTEVCKCGTLCKELSIFADDNGNKHLSLNDKFPPFKVMFIKA